MAPVGRGPCLAGEEIEPLAALHVVGQRERLELPGLERSDVLLDVSVAEGVGKCDVALIIERGALHEELLVPYDEGGKLAELYALGPPIESREDREDGVLIRARLPERGQHPSGHADRRMH